MGRPPAVIIIARYVEHFWRGKVAQTSTNLSCRHGARLDAADAQWHLTSPTPYDPPLTYGGWRQSQALGAKIANIIHSRAASAGSRPSSGLRVGPGANGDGDTDGGRNLHHSYRGKRRKHKIVIHSSPFLRCVQTSVAVSAGIAQYQGNVKANVHASPMKHTLHSGFPHTGANDHLHGRSAHLSAIPEPEATGLSGKSHGHTRTASEPRTLLRVDAFLGEWLSPDYFDKITPPPESKLMVAGAKADLLRRGEPIDKVHASSGHFPGGWGSAASTKSDYQSSDEDTPLADLSDLSQSLPRLGRANSHSIGISTRRTNLDLSDHVDRSPTREAVPYVPPTPSYAVSPSQPIPQGYVAHARDACVKVDYQWDSLRPPLDWGNGGNYGEEWSSMHKRFRRGLHEMILWYRNHDPIALKRTLSEGLPEDEFSEDPDDDETDTVLILVTHGSGCNALIGALTNQPVLLDVGMASLTMAVRKTVDYKRMASPSDFSPQTSPSRRRRSSVLDLGFSNDYEIKMTASTDHLRPGSQYLPGSQLQRTSTLPIRDKSPYRYERHNFADLHSKRSPVVDDDTDFLSGSDTATPTKKDKFDTINNRVSSPESPSGGGGLWSKTKSLESERAANDIKKPLPIPVSQLDGFSEHPSNVLHERPNGLSTNGHNIENKRSSSASEKNSQERSIAPSGLWGAPPHALATERDTGSKRRWTLSQAS